jgi:hypothetical protein
VDGNRGLGGRRGLGASKSSLKGREVILTIEIYCLTFILVIYGRKWNYSDLTNSHEVMVLILMKHRCDQETSFDFHSWPLLFRFARRPTSAPPTNRESRFRLTESRVTRFLFLIFSSILTSYLLIQITFSLILANFPWLSFLLKAWIKQKCEYKFTGKVIVITGAACRIGLTTSKVALRL